MDDIDLRREFEKETGKKAVVINQYTYPTEQYEERKRLAPSVKDILNRC